MADPHTQTVTFRVGQSRESEYHQKLLDLVGQGYRFVRSTVKTDQSGATREVTIVFFKPGR